MEGFVNQFISFILFLVNAIKDMVAVLSGRKSTDEVQDEPAADGE